jgi:predicted DNA-binding transcriptional regulator AlpA
MNYHQTDPPDRILNIREVMHLTTLSRSTILRKAGRSFPAPIRLTPSGSRVGWDSKSVDSWLKDPTGWAERDET